MKRFVIAAVLLLTACTSPGRESAANQFSTPLPSPTLAVITKTIEGADIDEALNYFYELKIMVAAREFHHFVDEVRYPITINVEGQPKTFVYAATLEVNLDKIFSEEEIKIFIATDESELTFTANGVKVADGIIWFDLICVDPDCINSMFMITEINN